MKFLRKWIAAILPWPARWERKQAIEEARRQREISQADVEHARRLEHQFRQIVDENHFAESIARQIIRKGEEKGHG